MTLNDWIGSHPFLDPLARVRRRIDAAVDASVTPLPVPSQWDEYVEEFAAGVPLLHSQVPIDLEPAGHAIVTVVHRLAMDPLYAPLAADAAALDLQLQGDPLAPSRVVAWLLGDESWQPIREGALRSIGWITLSASLRPLVQAFAGWRDPARWVRRYCPTCGALPAMAQLVGIDPGRRRLLTCGRCTSQWRYVRTGCPFCETESHRLTSVGVDGEGGLRIDYCEACHGYVKTYNGQGNEEVLLADWTSLHLDLIARERGLTRAATSLYDLGPGLPDAPPAFGAASGASEPISHGASPAIQ